MTQSRRDLKERVGAGIARRNRSEKAFRALGFGALLVGLVFLGFFFYTLIANGYTAFRQTRIQLDIQYTADVIDPDGTRDPDVLTIKRSCATL
jgi:phosphate transport system permease protein